MRFDKMETHAEYLLQLTSQEPPREAMQGPRLFIFLLSIGTEALLSTATFLWILSFSRELTCYS